MIKNITKIFLLLNLPILASAAVLAPNKAPGTLGFIFDEVAAIVDKAVPILLILVTIVFIWGIIQYVLAGGSDTRKKEAKNLIIWGLIGALVAAGVWGLVEIIRATVGAEFLGTPDISVPGKGLFN